MRRSLTRQRIMAAMAAGIVCIWASVLVLAFWSIAK